MPECHVDLCMLPSPIKHVAMRLKPALHRLDASIPPRYYPFIEKPFTTACTMAREMMQEKVCIPRLMR